MLPPEAQKRGVRIRWWQPKHAGRLLGDWAIDNVRVGGDTVNPPSFFSDFTDGFNDTEEWYAFDNAHTEDYCGLSKSGVGNTLAGEPSTLTTRDLNITDIFGGQMMQFFINIGCMHPWNATVSPVNLQFSTDHGVTWSYLNPQCLPNEPKCKNGPSMPSIYHDDGDL